MRLDKEDAVHAHVTIFINGQNTGRLVMSPAQAAWFRCVLSNGCDVLATDALRGLQFEFSGDFKHVTRDRLNAEVENLVDEGEGL